MNPIQVETQTPSQTKSETKTQYVYFFGAGAAEGMANCATPSAAKAQASPR
jgi:hypothetical protein